MEKFPHTKMLVSLNYAILPLIATYFARYQQVAIMPVIILAEYWAQAYTYVQEMGRAQWEGGGWRGVDLLLYIATPVKKSTSTGGKEKYAVKCWWDILFRWIPDVLPYKQYQVMTVGEV